MEGVFAKGSEDDLTECTNGGFKGVRVFVFLALFSSHGQRVGIFFLPACPFSIFLNVCPK